MVLLQPLVAEQRAVSQKNYNRYHLVNGASYMCLGETVIILFAVRLDMPNVLITAIGAMIYIGFLLLPLGVRRTAKVGAAQSQADFWVCRNIAALMVAASAVIAGFSHELAWGMLLFGAFLFYGFRAAGVVMCQPLIGDITTAEDRSGLIGKSAAFFYLSGVTALLVISLILKFNSNLPVLCGVIVTGAVLGIAASGFIRGICETEAIRQSARKPLLPQLRESFRDPAVLRIVAAGFAANFAIILITPASVLAIKKGYGVSDTAAILFSIVQFAASILAASAFGKIPLRFLRLTALLGYGTVLAVGLFWLLTPPFGTFLPMVVSTLVFFLQGIAISVLDNTMICYFLMSVPKEKQIAASVAVNVVKGAGSGLAGMGVAGFLIWFSGILVRDGAPPISLYRFYFGMTLPVLLGCVVPILRLKNVCGGSDS